GHADDEGIEEDGDRESEAHRLDERHVLRNEGREHGDHDQGGGGDHAGTVLETVGGGIAGGLTLGEALTHAGDQEDLVIHGQAEDQADEHDRQEGQDRLRIADDTQPTLLEDGHGGTEGGGHR